MSRSGPDPEVYQLTDAATAHSDDLDARITKYLISMAIRTLCVVLVFVVDHWTRWVFAVGAVALPYVAVILANNTGRVRGRPARPVASPSRALRSGATTDPIAADPIAADPIAADPIAADPVVLTGVVHRDPARPTPSDAGPN